MTTSVITNASAILAVEVLNATSSSLVSVQKQVSTGYRVADATDDGAAFAVAQSIRSSIGGLTTANQQLGNATGLLNTTLSAVTDISNLLNSAKEVLVDLANQQNQTSTTLAQYKLQYTQLIRNIKNEIEDAVYHGISLIADVAAGSTTTNINVVRNEVGGTYYVAATGFAGFTTGLFGLSSGFGTPDTVAPELTTTGTFTAFQSEVGTILNNYGAAINYVSNQISYNNDKIDALNIGLGALVDANLTNESAQLQALQVRQQLATQSLAIANAAPQNLLKLFQ
jgi:flagellin